MTASPSPFAAGIAGRCPRCGEGRLFAGYLALAPSCDSCGLDYRSADSGDGPAVFVIFIVGFVVVVAALVTELAARPPIWLHLALWIPLIFILSAFILRPAKGIFVAVQYRHRAAEGRLHSGEDE